MNETSKALLEVRLLSKWELTVIEEIDRQLASKREQQVFIDFFFFGRGLKFSNCLLVTGKISKDVFLLVHRYSSLEICSIEGTQLNLGTAEILICILTLQRLKGSRYPALQRKH